MNVREGAIEVAVPEQSGDSIEDAVFFNPNQELNRDITIAVLRAYAERNEYASSYLDATAASGIRGVRAANEGWEATCCDVDEEAVSLCEENFERNGLAGTAVRRNANALMHEERFDVVDVDPFGTPIPFADAAFNSAHNLVCVTATDTAPLCGAHFNSGVRKYSAVPRNTDYHAEMGLRILLSALARTAARYDVGVTPILSHVTRHYVRVYLECSPRATDANHAIDELGYVHHCNECMHREWEDGMIAHPPAACPNCETSMVTAGPVWLGAIRDRHFTAQVRDQLSEEMGQAKKAERMLATIEDELDLPFHFDQHKVCKQWGISAPAMDDFLEVLHEAGYEARRAHYGGTTFHTDATIAEIEDAARARFS
ncbi:tRNA (guanine(26)-N(2))-dimethyltransferase [Haladaptatus sp. DYSN1]|uniref:tRNA (guanine(26)-N(2))-dimethyltransferase n=1 Tax=unclassified Haladaptatus TaxID=2622732 RepID=UPI0024062725|nr:tRNA (guanine(26)-N(2))-dimethyltransferase [Haladaptatus sp. DYSN1]